ncbi:Telomere recombination [Musa troglodytarum]|uniref:Threonylcarbamoyl-AMP synthase n=1 Tax=Musa troglodytarum TaxID=320322 RepID=A0A9E7G639_9LILI|nr:Telomere recombination [Musa troglodytarum]
MPSLLFVSLPLYNSAAYYVCPVLNLTLGNTDCSFVIDDSEDEVVITAARKYAIVCDLRSYSSIERLRRIKDIESKKPLSILCHSFQDIDKYTVGFPRGDGRGQTNIFRTVKHCLPGPYTFILPATKELPKQCIKSGRTARYESRKHVGVRMPNDSICQAILQNLDEPLVSTSVKWPSEDQWMLDPVIIADTYGPEGLDFVVDGGVRVADPSTVVDMTGRYPTIIRQGKGPKLEWMIVAGEDYGGGPSELKASLSPPIS